MSTQADPSDDFRKWMDSRKLRAADVCGPLHVSEQAIHNWRSAGVPPRRWPHVRKLMSEWADPPGEGEPPEDYICKVGFTDREIDEIFQAARIVDTTPRDFIRRAATHQARAALGLEVESLGNGTTG